MKTTASGPAARFVEDLLGSGRFTFTRDEAESRLGRSSAASYMALRRLVKARWLVMPRAGFYVIVDAQHRSAGSLPPEWFVHDLMRYLKRPYYCALLSAARIHGAAHQSAQVFQVMIPVRTMRPVRSGRVRIRFFGKGPFDQSSTQDVKTPSGQIQVSSPETTAWDLVRYPWSAGGLDNVMTVLSELADTLRPGPLLDCVRRHDELVVAQRLGFLLDQAGHARLTGGLAKWIAAAPVRALDPGASASGFAVDARWHLRVNATLNPET
jgi:predicted transcriptional regulator of viral defense system